MIDVVVALLLQATPAVVPATPDTVAVTGVVEAEKPKETCRWERETGSRLKKTKVCRIDESVQTNDQQTALARAMQNKDYAVPQGGEIVNGRSGLGR